MYTAYVGVHVIWWCEGVVVSVVALYSRPVCSCVLPVVYNVFSGM